MLDVGYVEAGPADGPAVLLLHGWPYDIHSFAEVAPLLAASGYRVIVPYLRGYGTTRFLADDDGPQRPAGRARRRRDRPDGRTRHRARDRRPVSTGARGRPTSWRRSGRSAATGSVSVSGYLIGSQAAGSVPLPPAAELQWWYQYYFATERGRAGYEANRRDFARLIWQTASPQWEFDDATFDRSAAAFDNPDHVAIVIHNYRWRLGLADGEAAVRRAGASGSPTPPPSPCPPSRSRATPTVHRIPSRARTPRSSRARTSTGRSTGGIGHNLPQEAPEAFARAILDVAEL